MNKVPPVKIVAIREGDDGSVITSSTGRSNMPSAESLFDACVRSLAAEYGLSERETQVFGLLARGRDRERVQNRLVISKDTAKAHIKHVYCKLGIHSQQELIDLVEDSLSQENANRDIS